MPCDLRGSVEVDGERPSYRTGGALCAARCKFGTWKTLQTDDEISSTVRWGRLASEVR